MDDLIYTFHGYYNIIIKFYKSENGLIAYSEFNNQTNLILQYNWKDFYHIQSSITSELHNIVSTIFRNNNLHGNMYWSKEAVKIRKSILSLVSKIYRVSLKLSDSKFRQLLCNGIPFRYLDGLNTSIPSDEIIKTYRTALYESYSTNKNSVIYSLPANWFNYFGRIVALENSSSLEGISKNNIRKLAIIYRMCGHSNDIEYINSLIQEYKTDKHIFDKTIARFKKVTNKRTIKTIIEQFYKDKIALYYTGVPISYGTLGTFNLTNLYKIG